MSSCITSPFLLFFSDFLGSSLVQFNPKEVSFSLAPQNPAVIPAVGIKNTTRKPNTLISVAFGFPIWSCMVCLGDDRAAAPVLPNKTQAAAAPPTAPRRAGAGPGPRHDAVPGVPRRGVVVNLEGGWGIQTIWKTPKFWGGYVSNLGDVMILFNNETTIISAIFIYMVFLGFWEVPRWYNFCPTKRVMYCTYAWNSFFRISLEGIE